MANLQPAQRAAVHGDYMREDHGEIAITKQDLRAAVDAVDTWLENNRALFNAAIPQPARNGLTNKQKFELVAAVLLRRLDAGAEA